MTIEQGGAMTAPNHAANRKGYCTWCGNVVAPDMAEKPCPKHPRAARAIRSSIFGSGKEGEIGDRLNEMIRRRAAGTARATSR
jgi:hypothetical protein